MLGVVKIFCAEYKINPKKEGLNHCIATITHSLFLESVYDKEGKKMSFGYILWVLAVAIAVIVGLAKFMQISLPVVTPALMGDSTLSLFIALALSLIAKWI